MMSGMADVRIHESWKQILAAEFEKTYWQQLTQFVRQEYQHKKVFPPAKHIFRAFDLCPLDQVKVVIVGQDPYHGLGQATGLSFAVADKVTLPPSLQNIFKEIQTDLGITPIGSGDLTRWATQGVLLLNSVLTVAANSPASHKEKGWEAFTNAAINALNTHRKNVVYLLWGKYAQTKGELIDQTANCVLKSGHPSPYSASLFFGHHHFSRANQYLEQHGLGPIDWS